ncbi:MAG: FIST C-terminal domain-containing protein, partial [Rhodospirillaceae bacterium]|nr:FIST C-terminal domain-containing protein [Rhodospirillaceae bacterium]
PLGYRTGSLTGLSMSRTVCHAEAIHIDRLSEFAFSHGLDSVRAVQARLAETEGPGFAASSFAMLMIDGMSSAEDSVLSALHAGLGEIPLFGGSAGDDLNFRRTWVYKDGAFHSDMAMLVLVHTPFPFRVFKTQHFIGSDTKMVITEADPLRRIVTEINAEPAGREFARMLGMEVQELTPMIFATHPVVVRVGGADYVRSIQKVNPDGSLSFFCAIDEGLVLSVATTVDPYENLTQVFDDIRAEIGPPQLIIGCECVLRSLEMERTLMKQRMGELLIANNVVGFNTYGEQFNAMHVNQTFTGVALGRTLR